MSFKIIGDSCCDYPMEGGDYPWLERVALSIDLEHKTFVDNTELDCNKLLKAMETSAHAPKSACPSPGAFEEAYDCGADDIYVVTLSASLSGTYASAVMAGNMLKEKYPERKVHVFDSKTAASGEIAICEKIYALASSGLNFEAVVAKTEAFIASMNTFFVLENLEVFRKNGRLNHLQSIITSALKLKLVMGGDEKGAICVRGKALTIDRALNKMADQIAEKCKFMNISDRFLYVTQCNCPERAKKACELIVSKAGFKGYKIFKAGGISTIYANAGGLVVCF